MRQIVLDTETTGLDPSAGHRIIEIGCVEVVNRRVTGGEFHQYVRPDREIDEGAVKVHGITDAFLADKPDFEAIVQAFIEHVRDAELVIHNAPFDVGFINAELALLGPEWGRIEDYCRVTDTLALARKMHPGQRNSLDALCQRYEVNNAHRELHGALLDARILADVWLAMTGGQATLTLNAEPEQGGVSVDAMRQLAADRPPLPVLRASVEELAAHERYLDGVEKEGGACLWRRD